MRVGQHVFADGHHADEREHELAVGQRVLRAVAQDDSRQQVGAVGRRLHALGAAILRAVRRPRRRSRGRRRSSSRCARRTPASANGASSACSSSAARGTTWLRRCASACAISFAHARSTQRPDAFTHDRPPLSATEARDDLEVVLPVVDAILADDHLAVAGAVHLDARVALATPCGRRVAEEHAAARTAQHLAAAGVVRRVEAERRFRARRPAPAPTRCGRASTARQLPGLRTSGVFMPMAGAHSECTPGELFGSTTPSECPRG